MPAQTKKTRSYALKLVVTVTLLVVIVTQVDVEALVSCLKGVSGAYIPSILALYVLNRIFMALRLRVFLGPQGGIVSFLRLVKIVFLSGFIGLLVPGGVGIDAVRLFYIQRQRGMAGGASIVIADRLVGIVAMTLVASMGVAWAWQALPEKHLGWSIWGFSGVTWLVVVVLLWHRTFACVCHVIEAGLRVVVGKNVKIERLVRKVLEQLEQIHLALIDLLRRPSVAGPVLIIALLMLAVRVSIVVLLFRSLGVTLPVQYAAAFVPMIFLLVLMPVSFFGIGVNDGAYVYFFSGLVVGTGPIGVTSAFAASLLSHLMVQTVQIVGGVLFLFSGPRLMPRAVERQHAIDSMAVVK